MTKKLSLKTFTSVLTATLLLAFCTRYRHVHQKKQSMPHYLKAMIARLL